MPGSTLARTRQPWPRCGRRHHGGRHHGGDTRDHGNRHHGLTPEVLTPEIVVVVVVATTVPFGLEAALRAAWVTARAEVLGGR